MDTKTANIYYLSHDRRKNRQIRQSRDGYTPPCVSE